MKKSDHMELLKAATRATWTIDEAAYLVNGFKPNDEGYELDPKSSNDVSRDYWWLVKEYKKKRLYSVKEIDGVPIFIPGTILRHMREKKRKVSQVIWGIYAKANDDNYDKESWKFIRGFYVDAAKLIWQQAPDLTASAVARELVPLPTVLSNSWLPRLESETIRKWLRGMGPKKIGRPKKSLNTKKIFKINIQEIAKKLQ